METNSFGLGMRTTIVLKMSRSTRGMSETSISSSLIFPNRSQLVLDFVPVDVLFIFCRLSGRDDAYGVFFRLGEHDHGHDRLQHANPNPAILAVICPLIEKRNHGMLEHRRHIQEVNPVPPDVQPVLSLIPFIGHGSNVYTKCIYVKRRCS